MRGLLLDTSTDQAVIGLACGQSLIETRLLPSGRGLSGSLFPAIEPLCKGLDYIAVGVGPGSYMGVRTGATAAKLLAFSKGLPLIGFPSLLVAIPENQEGPFLLVGDAKMGEHFTVSGVAIGGKVSELTEPELIPAGTAGELLAAGQVLIDVLKTPIHLNWALSYTLDLLDQKKTTDPEALSLSYIR